MLDASTNILTVGLPWIPVLQFGRGRRRDPMTVGRFFRKMRRPEWTVLFAELFLDNVGSLQNTAVGGFQWFVHGIDLTARSTALISCLAECRRESFLHSRRGRKGWWRTVGCATGHGFLGSRRRFHHVWNYFILLSIKVVLIPAFGIEFVWRAAVIAPLEIYHCHHLGRRRRSSC